MCRTVTCPKCNRPTFAGCGMHVEQVLGHVPQAERCQCGSKSKEAPSSQDANKAQKKRIGWLQRL